MTKGEKRVSLHELKTVRVVTPVAMNRTKTATEPNYLTLRTIEAGRAAVWTLTTDGERRLILKQMHTYMRSDGSRMTASDVRDLEILMSMLRSYYDIPDGEPVFPKRPPRPSDEKRATPSRDAKNAANHPWRGAA